MERKRRFQFSIQLTMVGIVAAALCYPMSYWQYTRYREKQEYFARLERLKDRGPVSIAEREGPIEPWLHAEATVTGQYDFDREIFITNRSYKGQPGAKLVTPFKLKDSDKAILIDRGFIPYKYTLDQASRELQVPGQQTITAFIRPSQSKAFFLAPPLKKPEEGDWIRRWVRLDVDTIQAQFPYPLEPYYLESNQQMQTYPIPTPEDVLPASRHLNYTLQWASFGTFALFFMAFLQFRKRPHITVEQARATTDNTSESHAPS